MENKIIAIIEKVKSMFRYDRKLSDTIQMDPQVICKYKDGELKLREIRFDDYSRVSVYESYISYIPERGNSSTLIEYKDWDELLNK